MTTKNEDKKIKRARITVKGRVQGIFFRSSTKRIAAKLGLKGYVKNLPDGNVEVVAEGNEEKIKKLIEFCKTGPSLSKVEDADIKFEKPTKEFGGFEVRY